MNNVQPGPIDTDLNPAAGDWATPQKAVTALNRYGRLMRSLPWSHLSPVRRLHTSPVQISPSMEERTPDRGVSRLQETTGFGFKKSYSLSCAIRGEGWEKSRTSCPLIPWKGPLIPESTTRRRGRGYGLR